MGISTYDLFGAAAGAQSAELGTYGEPPSGYRLAEATRLGRMWLQVSELERSLLFYQDVLGFRIVKRASGEAAIAAHGDERILIELSERPGARPANRRGRLGLYHFAILLPDRGALGRFARHLSTSGIPEAEYAAVLVRFGLPEAAAKAYASYDTGASMGGLFDNGRQLSALIGRPTTPLKATVADALAQAK